jgi:hypothetical protein
VEVGKGIRLGAVVAKRMVAVKVFAPGAVLGYGLLSAQVEELELPAHRIGSAEAPTACVSVKSLQMCYSFNAHECH